MYSSSLIVFGTEDQDGFVAVLIVFDNGQRGEGFTQAYAVCKNTAVEFFELTNNCKNSISLEVIKHSPNFTVLESGCLIGQLIVRNVLQELIKNIVESKKVNEIWRIFFIGSTYTFNYNICYFLKFLSSCHRSSKSFRK